MARHIHYIFNAYSHFLLRFIFASLSLDVAFVAHTHNFMAQAEVHASGLIAHFIDLCFVMTDSSH